MQGVQVWSLMGELGSCMPCGATKKKKKIGWDGQFCVMCILSQFFFKKVPIWVDSRVQALRMGWSFPILQPAPGCIPDVGPWRGSQPSLLEVVGQSRWDTAPGPQWPSAYPGEIAWLVMALETQLGEMAGIFQAFAQRKDNLGWSDSCLQRKNSMWIYFVRLHRAELGLTGGRFRA